jgi:uncharacterized protein YndB with AHSA1/START domain
MATVRNHVRIAAPADEVWARIGDPERIAEWFPGMGKVVVHDGQRVIANYAGQTVVEKIVTNDPLRRRFQYSLDRALVPITYHLATVDVIDLEDGTCLAMESTEIDPPALAFALHGAIQAAFEELKRQVEEGT